MTGSRLAQLVNRRSPAAGASSPFPDDAASPRESGLTCGSGAGGGARCRQRDRRGDLARAASPAPGGAPQLRLLVGVALSLPGNQDAAVLEQRRGQLGESRESTDGTGGYRPHRPRAARRRNPLSGSLMTRALAIRAASIARWMKSHFRPTDSIRSTRQRAGQPPARAPETPPQSQYRRSDANPQLLELKPGEAVLDMHPPGPRGSVTELTDARSVSKSSRTVSRRAPTAGRGASSVEPCAAAQNSETEAVRRPRSRRGSSPSLYVSTPERSLRCSCTTRRSCALIGSISTVDSRSVPARRPGRRGTSASPCGGRGTGGVDDHPLALAHPPESSLVGDQLQGVDRLPPFADQQPVILVAGDRGVIRSSSSAISTSPSRSSSSSTPSTSSRPAQRAPAATRSLCALCAKAHPNEYFCLRLTVSSFGRGGLETRLVGIREAALRFHAKALKLQPGSRGSRPPSLPPSASSSSF